MRFSPAAGMSFLETCRISKASACFMLDLNDLKMYEDKIRTKEEQKAKEKQEKK